MASMEQKTALVSKYCEIHKRWVQNAEQHKQNYDSAMSDYASANRRVNSAQNQLNRLYDQISDIKAGMRDAMAELDSLNDGQEHSAWEFQSLKNRLESLKRSYVSAEREAGAVKGQLQQAQGEARQAYLIAQQENQQYEKAQANIEQYRQALEQMCAQLSREADDLQIKVNAESTYGSTLQRAPGNIIGRSALAASEGLKSSAGIKQAELTVIQALIDRIRQEIDGGSTSSSMGTRVLRRR